MWCRSVNESLLYITNPPFLLQVVRIQVQIQETLRKQYSQHPSVQGAISRLDLELMDITKVRHHRNRNSHEFKGMDFSRIKLKQTKKTLFCVLLGHFF